MTVATFIISLWAFIIAVIAAYYTRECAVGGRKTTTQLELQNSLLEEQCDLLRQQVEMAKNGDNAMFKERRDILFKERDHLQRTYNAMISEVDGMKVHVGHHRRGVTLISKEGFNREADHLDKLAAALPSQYQSEAKAAINGIRESGPRVLSTTRLNKYIELQNKLKQQLDTATEEYKARLSSE